MMSTNTTMQYRYLGNTGLKVSCISFGGWISSVDKSSEELMYQCMTKAFSMGVNFFDNAEVYANGESEMLFGKVFKRAGWKRSQFLVSTKIFWGGPTVNEIGLTRKHIVEGVKAACQRLQLDYVDLVFAHRPDLSTPMEEIVRAFNYVIDLGLAYYWGTSEWTAQQIQEAHMVARELGLIAPLMEQPEYNMLHREKMEREYVPFFHKYHMGTTVWSPLAGGLLTGKYLDNPSSDPNARANPQRTKFNSEMEKRWWQRSYSFYFTTDEGREKMQHIRELRDWMERKIKEGTFPKDCSLAQLSLAWVLKNPNVSSAIIGATKVEQVEQNIKALNIVLSENDMLAINEILKNAPEKAVDGRS